MLLHLEIPLTFLSYAEIPDFYYFHHEIENYK